MLPTPPTSGQPGEGKTATDSSHHDNGDARQNRELKLCHGDPLTSLYLTIELESTCCRETNVAFSMPEKVRGPLSHSPTNSPRHSVFLFPRNHGNSTTCSRATHCPRAWQATPSFRCQRFTSRRTSGCAGGGVRAAWRAHAAHLSLRDIRRSARSSRPEWRSGMVSQISHELRRECGHRIIHKTSSEPARWPRPFIVQEFVRMDSPEVHRLYGAGGETFGWVVRRFLAGCETSPWVAHAHGARA